MKEFSVIFKIQNAAHWERVFIFFNEETREYGYYIDFQGNQYGTN